MILEHVNHPFLVGLAYAFQTSNKLYFIMQFMRIYDATQVAESCSSICPTPSDSLRSRPSFMPCRSHWDWGTCTRRTLYTAT